MAENSRPKERSFELRGCCWLQQGFPKTDPVSLERGVCCTLRPTKTEITTSRYFGEIGAFSQLSNCNSDLSQGTSGPAPLAERGFEAVRAINRLSDLPG